MTISETLKTHGRRVGIDLGVLLVGAVVVWTLYAVWMRARNGESAWECLHQPQCVQSVLQIGQQARPAAPQPTK